MKLVLLDLCRDPAVTSQVSAHVSDETRDLMAAVVKRPGTTKARLIEEALQRHPGEEARFLHRLNAAAPRR
jgi:hypothetical protein